MPDPTNPCDPTIYDPAFQITIPAVDARDKFKQLSDASAGGQKQQAIATAHRAFRRASRKATAGPAGAVVAGDDSRSIGYWPRADQLPFQKSTAVRYVIVFPPTVGGDFASELYLTTTNRSNKGVEAHVAYAQQEPTGFWIYDWSLTKPDFVRKVPIAIMPQYVFALTLAGFARQGVLVMNQTRLVSGTTWINCVHLGVFADGKLDHYDAVYANVYTLAANAEQQPTFDGNGYWGPQLETFQNYQQPIHPMGFAGCWFIQDGVAEVLDETDTELHEDDFGLKLLYQTRQRDFLVN